MANTAEIQAWINIIGLALPLGEAVVRGIRSLMAQQGMTDAEINDAERAAIADSNRRKAERDDMGREGGGL